VHDLLGLVRLTRVVIQPRGVQRRLVAGPLVGSVRSGVELREERVEALDRVRVAADSADQPADVLRYLPGVLGGVALLEARLAEAAPPVRVRPQLRELPGAIARFDVAGGGVEVVRPVL
jgi:hypothetical protein